MNSEKKKLSLEEKTSVLIEIAKEDDRTKVLTLVELDQITDIAIKLNDEKPLDAQDQTTIHNIFNRINPIKNEE